MIDRLLDASVRFRWAVLAITAIIALYGAFQLFRLPIDAVPDITNKQVQVNVSAPQFSPLDMERLVTFPVETALAGIPGLDYTRSISRNGFAQVTAVFGEDVDLYFARQQVAERLAQAGESLPDGIQPQMGPVSTGLGEVLMWSVAYAPTATKESPKIPGRPGFQPDGSYLTPEGQRLTDEVSRLAYLRTVQDWIIRPQIRGVDGIAGVDSIGGYEKQFVVQPIDPSEIARLRDEHKTKNRPAAAGYGAEKDWERSIGCPSGQQRKQSQRAQRGTPAGNCRAGGRGGQAMENQREHGHIQANYPRTAKPLPRRSHHQTGPDSA